jgi:histidine ammonia-lyase
VTEPLVISGAPLTIDEVERVADRACRIDLDPHIHDRLNQSRAVVERALVSSRPYYGINTGFGSLARQSIDPDRLLRLQQNLIRSHAAGIGAPLPDRVVRAAMLVLAASLSRGYSGVRPIVVQSILELINSGITPVVPSIGSVGASGDLAPLAHIALALIGEGRATCNGRELDAASALSAAGIEPLILEPKEGLALINGTHLMTAVAALLLADIARLIPAAIVASAMSIEACKATDAFLDERVYKVRQHPCISDVARRLRACLAGSEIVRSHRENDSRVQDPYSFRCAAYVLGAAEHALAYAREAIVSELRAVTDNPLVFPDDDAIIAAGNFHGMPVAIHLDVVAIALAHVAGISQQRTFFLLAAREPESGLPPYLSPDIGVCSGMMVAQYTAAACCNELIGLAAPASVANLPTSAGIEDYNSFGPRAAAKAQRAVELTTDVVAIELLCAAHGIDLHRPLRSGAPVERAHALIRARVQPLTRDRPPSADITAIAELIQQGLFSVESR